MCADSTSLTLGVGLFELWRCGEVGVGAGKMTVPCRFLGMFCVIAVPNILKLFRFLELYSQDDKVAEDVFHLPCPTSQIAG